ncbi:MAG: PfkB family carbohydrate kinase, partial [Gammaproteobacteria bacterium]|nr:PfkB family carbohydrate kinase [Gammaproteobacteria bacterium]
MSESVGPRPLIVGEVLFDYFPSGERVLGGAPFNVAWHLHGFGLFPYFLSRIGTDPSADEIRLRMNDWGMDAGGLESDPKHPTGQVQIEFDPDGTHRFHIVPDQAYDYIDGQTHFNSAKKKPWGLLYVGTLAQRSPHSAQSIHDLFSLNVPRFVDVNLRAPWWDQATVDRTLNGAKW